MFIVISIILSYLIDLRNVFGSRDVLFSLSNSHFYFRHRPFVFFHWYRNGGLAEILQWLFLGGSALMSAFIAAKLQNLDRKAYMFWLIMAVLFVLMLIEDSGDPRHTIRSYVQALFLESGQGVMGSITELLYFFILSLLPIYAILRYGNILVKVPRSLIYFGMGFIIYGVATSLSFIGSAFDFYNNFGSKLRERLIEWGDESLAHIWQTYDAEVGFDFINFFLMDTVIEESLELIGAATLFGSVLYYLYYVNSLE